MEDVPTKGQRRRERRARRRQREILAAAAHVFAEKGYSASTTKEIADAADVAEGTLYNYFGGKRDILLAIVGETQAVVDAMFEQAGVLETREDAIALVERGYGILLSRLPFIRTLVAEVWLDDAILQQFYLERLQRLGKRVQAFIVDRIDARVFRPVDPEMATRMVLAMFVAPILPVLRGVVPVPSPEECHVLATQVIELFIDGVASREGGA